MLRGEAIVRVARRRALAVRQLALLTVRRRAIVARGRRWSLLLLLLLLLRRVALARRRRPYVGVRGTGVALRRGRASRIGRPSLSGHLLRRIVARGGRASLLLLLLARRRAMLRVAGRRRTASREASRTVRRWPVARMMEDLADLRQRVRIEDLARPRTAGARHAAGWRAEDLPRLGRTRAV
jgi:hypothetical protein